MGIWRSLLRSVLGEYGLVGRAIADRIDRDGTSLEEQTFDRGAPRQAAAPSMGSVFVPGPAHEPIREVTYQVLTNNSYWRTVGSGINAGSAVIDMLHRLKGEYPDLPVRAIDKITQTLIDIRT